MILVLTLVKNDLKDFSTFTKCLHESKIQALLCYGTTVGFSIIVFGDILRRLFSDIKDAIDKIEILNNVIAVILFTALGVSRVERYNSRYSLEWWIEAFEKGIEKQNYLELSDFSTGEI